MSSKCLRVGFLFLVSIFMSKINGGILPYCIENGEPYILFALDTETGWGDFGLFEYSGDAFAKAAHEGTMGIFAGVHRQLIVRGSNLINHDKVMEGCRFFKKKLTKSIQIKNFKTGYVLSLVNINNFVYPETFMSMLARFKERINCDDYLKKRNFAWIKLKSLFSAIDNHKRMIARGDILLNSEMRVMVFCGIKESRKPYNHISLKYINLNLFITKELCLIDEMHLRLSFK